MEIPALLMAETWTSIGTAVSVASALGQGAQASAQYDAARKANEYNAAVQRQRAEQVSAAYGQREDAQRRMARVLAGQRAAAVAQSGTGFGGSNADVMEQSDVLAELDALNIRYAGQLESQGLLNQATLEDYYGRVNTMNASSSRTRGLLGAAGAYLSGSGDYLRVKNPGKFGGRMAPTLGTG